MAKRHKLECLGKEVTMIVDEEKGVAFDGWDERVEQSWMAIGGADDPSPCMIVAQAVVEGKLDKELFNQAPEGSKDVVLSLLAAGADINAKDSDGWMPLHWALLFDNVDVAKNLIRGAEVNVCPNNGWLPLTLAVRQYDPDIVVLLLKEGADVRAQNSEALNEARLKGNKRIIGILEDWLEKHPDD